MAQKKLIYLFYVLICSFIPRAQADNFLLPQPDAHRSTVPQVKQKIGECLSKILFASNRNIQLCSHLQIKLLSNAPGGSPVQELVKELANTINLQAQVAYEIYNRIQDLVDNNKNAFLNKAYKPELLDCLKKLEQLYQQELVRQQRMPKTVNQPALEQVKKQQKFDQQEITNALSFIKNGCVVSVKK